MNRLLIFFLTLIPFTMSAQDRRNTDYARDWRWADSLAAKGLPKSALDIANRIYKDAKAQKNYPQVAKAAMYRLIFRSYSDEDAYVELVRSLRADINDTPEPARSVLESVLADVYWQYFGQNRYKFYNRATIGRATVSRANPDLPTAGKPATEKPATPTPTDSTADFTTWDGRQLIEAITVSYLASVREKAVLQATPIATYDALLDKGDPDARPLRSTLYDLLAHRAIAFFQNTEPDLLKPVFRFELDQPDYLAGPDVFALLSIQSPDSLSGRYQALRLYQQLLAFHGSDTNPAALADADVLRLAFVYRHSIVPERDSLYRQTLQKRITRFKNTPTEAVYAYQLAEFLANHGEPKLPVANPDEPTSESVTAGPNHWNYKQAADICRDISKRFPSARESQRAALLLNRLLLTTYSVQIEQVNAPNQPFRVLVNYQNVNQLRYRIVNLSLAEKQNFRDNYGTSEQQQKLFRAWLKRPLIAENVVTLPGDGDLNRHSVELPVAGLPIGHYLLLATADDAFREKTESIQMVTFTVSSLSYLLTSASSSESTQTLYVTNRLTGEPIPDASVTLIEPRTMVTLNSRTLFRTNATGRIDIPANARPTQTGYHYLIKVGKDSLLSEQQYYYGYSNGQSDNDSQTYTKLFTDRAIYRPGQSIYAKGLVYQGKTNQFSVVANEEVTIEFLDQNGEQIAKQTLKTNEFGTFTVNFTAPTGRLTGRMSLQTPDGSTSIRVEEYKRPTFEVKANPIQQSFKLGQSVTLTATAKTFSGVAVDGAEVRYRVVRKFRPRWDWWYSRPTTNQTEITNGVAKTDAQGKLSISFVAAPDREKARQDNPIFDFDVTIDVTDRAGETRSTTKTLHIGYSSLQATVAIPAQVETDKPVNFPIKVTNQLGEKVAAKGQLTIYRLQPPTRTLRNRLWDRPDRQLLSRAEFEKLFPHDLFANENDPRSWPKGDIIQQQSITTPTDSLLKPAISRYTPGDYVAELTLTDSAGETALDRVFFAVVMPEQPTASARPDGWLQARKTTAEPGEEAVFWVGNHQPGWVLMTLEENRQIVRQEWIKTDGRPRRVALPVSEKQRGGFAVHFAMIQNGRLYEKSQPITVPFTNKQLTIETQTFRSKLKPGEREEWTLKITGLAKTPAELVATLYDSSLDAFDKLDWPTSVYEGYSSFFYGWRSGSFGALSSRDLIYRYRPQPILPERQYDQLGWLGYRFSTNGRKPFHHNPVGPFGVSDDAIRITIRRAGKTISGTVKYKNGLAASGVSILVKGTVTGAASDEKGQFNLVVDSLDKPVTLIFSYIGYRTNDVTIGQKSVSTQLLPDAQQLSEVVVTGYATQARRDLTGAVASVPGGGARAKAALRQGESMDSQSVVELKEAVAAEKPAGPTSTQNPVINPRRNFNETAFFLPQLQTDAQGRVVLKFTMPEALTRWRLLAFAHTKDLKIGTLERDIITQKELMITANAPRFLREGDTIRIMARVNNLTEKVLQGSANLLLTDALTGEPLDQKIKILSNQSGLTLPPGGGQAVGWTLVIPAGLEAVTCRLTAQSGLFTDGEEFTLPVLPNRMLVTDTQPFWVNGPGSKEFKLKSLTNLNPELPVQHERLTVEVTGNPAWYALQSLPYLMEYRYECAEQLFSRLYANSLAAHIVRSKPAFREVITDWQKTPPRNPLQANEELRAVTLENSPWLADARSETARQAKLGQLLDANRLETEQRQTVDKLEQLQTENGNPAGGNPAGGGFRWFGGMEPNLPMTLHILSGFGHLQKLGVKFPDDLQDKIGDMQAKAIRYADAQLKQWVEEQKKEQTNRGWYFSATQYLYARSFYLAKPVDKAVLAYLKQQIADEWQQQSLQGQALAALALHRFGDQKTPGNILRSLRERTRESDEMGLYWPDNQSGLSWYQTPIETQAYLIEACDEINQDRAAVDSMKRWLLRQKQTQSWESTKATTEAIYALLLRGSDWLSTGATAQVSLGGQPIESRVTQADAITGYEKVTYAAAEIKPDMGRVQLTKKGNGPAWGALYWQHFEPLDRIMPGSAGLSIQKTLYVQRDSPSGPLITLVASQTGLKAGDLIKVRLVLKTDRVMEYVHVKDGRASGFEPVAALSGYKYQNGLGYYESPRDASTDFFISYLPVGTHVFEYDLRVAQTGDFSAGVATVQCFYAPEFSAHSAGERVKVK